MDRSCFSIILLMYLIVSCGGDKGSSSGKKTVPLEPEEIENILDRQNFSCGSDKSCPLGMSRLFIINPFNTSASSVCSGFLIASDTLVTNHHCVPSLAECRNTFISVNTIRGPMRSRCLSVEYSKADSEISTERSIDLTIMRIEGEIPPPYFRIHPSKVSPGRPVTAWVIDHVSVLDARVTELNCNFESLEASMLLRNCPAISGNSGSPVVLNGTRDVIGILWGSNVPSTIDASFPLNLRRELSAISLATEFYPLLRIFNGSDSSRR